MGTHFKTIIKQASEAEEKKEKNNNYKLISPYLEQFYFNFYIRK